MRLWLGVGVLLGSAVLILATVRPSRWNGVAVGLAWFWGLLLPVLGVVGGRVAAAQDRYLYQPLIGLLAVVGFVALRAVEASRPGATRRAALVFVPAGLAAAALVPWNAELCRDFRSTLGRAERVVALNPGDPRAVEMLAAAYDFLAEHSASPPTSGPAVRTVIDTLYRAAASAEAAPQFFRDTGDRAAFHRRLSYQLWDCGVFDGALAQAERAAKLEPDSAFTLTRLAHAHRALQHWDEARGLYERLEQIMPENPRYRALRYTEFGDLLFDVYEQPELAIEQYRRAFATGVAPARGIVGLARCEVLIGEGVRGNELIRPILARDPENTDAALVLGMYLLRSHKWEEAEYV